jgi:hypothetical protein
MKQDKRDPTHIIPFEFPYVSEEEQEPEVFGSMGLLLAIVAMLFRVRLFSFFGLLLSSYAWLNQKKSESGGFGSSLLSLSFLSFFLNYGAPAFMPLPKSV